MPGKVSKEKNDLYKVRFQIRDSKNIHEVVVQSVGSSEFLGLLTLEGFVFNDQKKQVILPTEDDARKRFGNVNRLHIPYHNILCIEEFTAEKTDLKKLPFIKGLDQDPSQDDDNRS